MAIAGVSFIGQNSNTARKGIYPAIRHAPEQMVGAAR
jgi:hypothetical protein